MQTKNTLNKLNLKKKKTKQRLHIDVLIMYIQTYDTLFYMPHDSTSLVKSDMFTFNVLTLTLI